LTVLTTADTGPGSLRAEIAAADSGDKIVFDPSLNGQTINLTTGELVINKRLDIEGPGGSKPPVTIGLNGSSRAFDITNPSTIVTLANLVITAQVPEGSGPFGDVTRGGDIFDAGATVNLVQDTLTGVAQGVAGSPGTPGGDGLGGAVYQVGGSLSLTQCSIYLSSAFGGTGGSGAVGGGGLGGGIYSAGGSLTAANCSFDTAAYGSTGVVGGTGAGGAVYLAAGATVAITNSSFVSIAGVVPLVIRAARAARPWVAPSTTRAPA
jgi:hypothetical protein